MRTRDGGKTWERLNSRTHLFIFGLSFPDALHGFFVGDRALVLSTTNGGESFIKRQLERLFPPALSDYALPYEEPVLYSASFLDDDHGWVVGELGRIWSTENGGKSWQEQQQSLVAQWKRPLGPSDDARFADFILPTLFSVSFRDQKHGAACGLEGWVVETDDGGKTWRFAHQAAKPGAPAGHTGSGSAADSGARSAVLDRAVRRQRGNHHRTDGHRASASAQRRMGARSERAGDTVPAQPGAVLRRAARMDRRLRHRSFTPRTAARAGACARARPRNARAGELGRTSMTWYRFGEWILRGALSCWAWSAR